MINNAGWYYSQAFDNLNPVAKALVWRALYDRLSGADWNAADDKRAPQNAKTAIAILAATKADLPPYWKPLR